MTNVFNDIDDYCESITTAIILAKNNILHTYVMSSNDLLIKLSQIQLRQSQKLPIELTKNTINEYYKLLKIEVNRVENNIMFIIKIPIVESTTYTLYEVIPLPIPHNSSHSLYIKHLSPYLLIDPSKTYYSQLQSLEDCSLAASRNYICHGVVINRVHEKPSCEIMTFITRKETISSMCQTRATKLQTEFWHSIAENEWLFVMTNTHYATLSCGPSSINDIEINNIGILQLSQNCKLYSDTIILESTSKTNQNFSQEKIPIYIDDVGCNYEEINTEISSIKLKPIKIVNVKTDETKIVLHALKQLETNINEESNESISTTKINWTSIILSLTAVTLISFFSWKLLQRLGLIKSIQQFFRHVKREESESKILSLEVYNTNINTSPRSRIRFCKELKGAIEGSSDFEDEENETDELLQRPIIREMFQIRERRSTSRQPSINME